MRCVLVIAALLAATAALADERSDRIEGFYQRTWERMPSSCRYERFGDVVLNREERHEYELPHDVGEEGIWVGRVLTQASVCGLSGEKEGLLCAFLKRNEQRLSPRQLMFGRELVRSVMQLLMTDVRIGDVVVEMDYRECTPGLRQKMRDVVDRYMAQVPGWREACGAVVPVQCVDRKSRVQDAQ